MAKIAGMEHIQSNFQLQQEIQQGAKFVIYQYCISVLVITFKRYSGVQYIAPDESRVVPGLIYTLLSFVLGWWGIPWGPIYTIQGIWINFSGGKDVTTQVLASMPTQPLPKNPL